MPEINPVYKEWRQELTNIQTKIDEFDEAFWGPYCNGDIPESGEVYEKTKAEFDIERQKMCDALEAHYANTPDMTL